MTILTKQFLDKYDDLPAKFGFGRMSQFIFYTKYSRIKDDGTKESWKDVLVRVVNGLDWISGLNLPTLWL